MRRARMRDNMAESLVIGMVVGEASGDILGAGLMVAIRARHPHAHFCGIGGPRMQALGFESFFAQDRLAVMGIVEPLKRLPELLRIRRSLRDYFIAEPPSVFVGVDSPDFNLTLEEQLHQVGIPTVHYVSPSVWAWRQGRITKIARAVDQVLTLFPFEKAFYDRHQVPAICVGHTLADQIPLETSTQEAREQLGLDRSSTLVALLPGSRAGEVARLLPDFLQAARALWRRCRDHNRDCHFVLPAASAERLTQIQGGLSDFSDLPLTLVLQQSHLAMQAADAVLMASGTTSLEAMLLKKPMVIAYRVSAMSYWILSRLVKVKAIGLPNLLAGKPLVPEFIQQAITPQALCDALWAQLQPGAQQALKGEFDQLHRLLRQDANERAADAVLALVKP